MKTNFSSEAELKDYIKSHKEHAGRNNKCMFCGKRERPKLNFGQTFTRGDGYHNSCMKKAYNSIKNEN